MYDEAIDESQEEYSPWGGLTPEQARDFRRALAARGVKGYWQEWLALLTVNSQHRYVEPTMIAYVYTRLGDKEQALNWLEKACDDKDNRARFLQVDPGFDTLRDDPRYQRLVRRIGLPL
jgi:hypothetical protein